MKFVWPPIMAALEERKGKIAEGLAAADRGQHAQELGQKKAAETLHEAKQQAAEIISKADKRASEIVEEAKDDARTEGERLLTAAKAEIESESNKAREALREKVAALVIAGAEKILRKEIDFDTHKDIVESVASEI